ncbi:MAG: hypothetical protein O2782_13690 [bacterium]|nr:hypothetical protein [bacterium]
MTQISYFGYDDCIALDNGATRVVLGTTGGRVLEYAVGGVNALMLDESQAGWRYQEGDPRVELCGGRCDIGPEQIIASHPDLWFGTWEGMSTGPRSARLVSSEDQGVGVQLMRDFELDRTGSHLRCTQTILNVSPRTIDTCHWSRTFAQGHGIVVLPVTEPSRFPRHYVMYGPGGIDTRPEDANIHVRDGVLTVTGPPQYAKLGMDSSAGWFAYLMRNDLLFVKRFLTYPDRVYNEIAGLTTSIWYHGTEVCELEPIGPRELLAPGESSSFTEEWWLLPQPFPADPAQVDVAAVVARVEAETIAPTID